MLKVTWLVGTKVGWLIWRRVESLLDSYKLGSAARSQAVSQGVGIIKDVLGELPWLDWLRTARSWGN